jgi:hypothetical protein
MAFTAFRVSATERSGLPNRPKCGVDLGDIRHGKVAADARVAEHLPAARVEKIYDLIFDRHRHDTKVCCTAAYDNYRGRVYRPDVPEVF